MLVRLSPSLSALLFTSLSLSAVQLPDLVGDWSVADLETPTRLREVYFDTITTTTRTSQNSSEFALSDEILVDAFYPDPAMVGTRSFSIAASGAVTGGEVGQILTISRNRVLYFDGAEVTTVYSNPTGDILVASGNDADQQELSICLKRPVSLATNELAGTWHLISKITPSNFNKDVGARLNDVWFPGESSLLTGNVAVSTTGVLSGLFPGSISATGPGTADVIVDGETFPFAVNASKDVMTSTLRFEDDKEEELIVLVKKPTTLVTSDLEGTWRLNIFQIPSTLTKNWFNVLTEGSRQTDSSEGPIANEVLADIFHREPFMLERYTVNVDSAGTITGLPGGGTFSANPDQSVAFSDGDVFNINASKSFMIAGLTDPDSHILVAMIKTSDAPRTGDEESFNFATTPAPGGLLLFNWDGASNAGLQELISVDPEVWGPVPEAAGADSHLIDPASDETDTRIFRVAEMP